MYNELNQLIKFIPIILFAFFIFLLPLVSLVKVAKSYKKAIKEKSVIHILEKEKELKKFIFVIFFLLLFSLLFTPESCGELGCGPTGIFVLLCLIVNFGVLAIGRAIGESVLKKKYVQNPQKENRVRK